MGATRTLAEFVSNLSFAQLSKEVIEKTKGVILDTLGCAIAGYTLANEEFGWLYDVVHEMGGQAEATVFIEGFKTSAPQAALVNGTLTHTIDFDDTHLGSISHLGAPTVAAVLAMGEKVNAPGSLLITSLVSAYEVAGRVGKAIMPTHYKYWHPTSTLGVIAAGTAAARILGLGAEKVEQVISLAADSASGLRYCIDFGDFSKSYHPGLAAWKGIMAAQLIAKGAIGPKRLLEYKSGFCRAYSEQPNIEALTENLGNTYEIMFDSLKAYPTILCSHTPIQATLKVMKENKLQMEDLEAIHFRVTPTAPGQGMNYHPKTPLAARLSIPYCVARAAADGYIGMEHFTAEKIAEPEIKEFMSKITLESVPSFLEKYPGTLAAQIKLKTKDGRVFEDESICPKGHPQNPMSQEEIKEKFRKLALYTLTQDRVDKIIKIVDDLENMSQTGRLIDCLSGVS
ncbi:MAG: MmgE/PrpD family protein [bacterium]